MIQEESYARFRLTFFVEKMRVYWVETCTKLNVTQTIKMHCSSVVYKSSHMYVRVFDNELP